MTPAHIRGLVDRLLHLGTIILIRASDRYLLFTHIRPTAILFSVVHAHLKLANHDLQFKNKIISLQWCHAGGLFLTSSRAFHPLGRVGVSLIVSFVGGHVS